MTVTTAGAPARGKPARTRQPRALRPVSAGILAIAGFAAPFVFDDVWLGLAIEALVLGLFALSIGWLSSRTGMLSLGHGAFYGSSAYFVAIATTRWGWNLTVAFFGGIIAAVLIGVLVGAVSIRTKGIGFAMVTLAFGQGIYLLSIQQSLRPTTGGDDGLTVALGNLLWIPSENLGNAGLWPLVWGAVVVVCVLLAIVNRSRYGLLLELIRDNQERAKFSGFDTYVPRLGAFALSSLVAGVAGSLFAVTVGFVSPANLFWLTSAYAIISAVVGGVHLIGGPLLGAVIYTLLTDGFATTGNFDLYLGIIFIVVMVLMPAGIAGVPRLVRGSTWLENRRNRSKS